MGSTAIQLMFGSILQGKVAVITDLGQTNASAGWTVARRLERRLSNIPRGAQATTVANARRHCPRAASQSLHLYSKCASSDSSPGRIG